MPYSDEGAHNWAGVDLGLRFDDLMLNAGNTDAEKAAARRVIAGQPDAALLLDMLGLTADE